MKKEVTEIDSFKCCPVEDVILILENKLLLKKKLIVEFP